MKKIENNIKKIDSISAKFYQYKDYKLSNGQKSNNSCIIRRKNEKIKEENFRKSWLQPFLFFQRDSWLMKGFLIFFLLSCLIFFCDAVCVNNCSNHGECVLDAQNETMSCQCQTGYANDNCSYMLKSKSKAFLLSFFLGSAGADRFYLGYLVTGVFKLLMTLMLCIIICLPLVCLCCMDERYHSACITCSILGFIFLFLGIWIWWLVDWLLIVTNSIPDSQGYPLLQDL